MGGSPLRGGGGLPLRLQAPLHQAGCTQTNLHSRIIGWLILGTSCVADPDPSNLYHFLEPRSVLDPDPT